MSNSADSATAYGSVSECFLTLTLVDIWWPLRGECVLVDIWWVLRGEWVLGAGWVLGGDWWISGGC